MHPAPLASLRRSLMLLMSAFVGPLSAATLWIEGEVPTKSTMHRHPWWYDQVQKEMLSGGDWISNFDEKNAGEASYDFEAPEKGDYTFWVRANPVASALGWKLDAGEWSEVDFKNDPRGQQNIAADHKPDLRFICWVKVGRLALTAGKHTIAFRMHSPGSNHGGLDCFVLTTDAFSPQGTMKPGAVAQAGPADWFPLMAEDDTFSAESVIDMSALTEAPAGRHGFLQARGKDLVFAGAAAKPVKFWGCGANLEFGKYTREQLTQRIKYLRKFGCNAVREHPVFDDVTTDGKLDEKKLDAFDWYVAELKKHGLYIDWSVFYHFPISPADGYDPALFNELEPMGKTGLRDSYGLITISPKLWDIRTKWLTALLTHTNPYTGLRYSDDPVLAVVEMQNEDSVFFWNPLGDLANANPKKWPLHAKMLRRQFAAWAKKKYGTDEALKAAWGKLEGESLANGELRVMGPWDVDHTGESKRGGDNIQFLTEQQRGLYEQCEKAMRAAGFKAVSATTNWLAGSRIADPANIFTDTVGGLIDRHNYAGGGAGVHGIAEGKVYAESHLGKPGAYLFGIGLKQVEDKPFSITEWTMCPPNQWKLECAPILAFYGMGLQGWDASYHFAQSGTRLGDGWPGQSSYSTDTPHYIGQFPALAFALQKGHLTESPIVAARRLTEFDLFSGKPPLRQDYYDGEEFKSGGPGATPAEVFAMGRVTVGFHGGKDEQADLAKLWDREKKVIQSATGELTWDYGREVVTVHSPKTQAVIGKAGGRKFELPGVSADFQTPFVSTIFTPLDDRPLAESQHVLITALARDKQTGARYSADGTKLEAVGTAPLLLEPVQAVIKFAGVKPTLVRPLDHYGVPRKNQTVPVRDDGSFNIDGTARAYYFEVKR